MEKEKKELQKVSENNDKKMPEPPALRQIIIETDGNVVKLIKAEVAGNLELSAILKVILSKIEIE